MQVEQEYLFEMTILKDSITRSKRRRPVALHGVKEHPEPRPLVWRAQECRRPETDEQLLYILAKVFLLIKI
jgi:hypothetical protein